MLVGIHKYRFGKFPNTLQVYEKILAYNKIKYIRLDVSEPDFWEKVKNVDLFIFAFYNVTDLKEIARSILPIVQNYMQIKCFPDIASSWHYDDKIKEYYLLRQAGFPIINSFIFWDKQVALKWSETADYPLVFKLKAGSASQSVLLVKNRFLAKRLINKMFRKGINPNRISFTRSAQFKEFTIKILIHNIALKLYRVYKSVDVYPLWEKQKNCVLFQEFQPNNTYDTRVTVIGDRAFGFIRYNRTNDFRASGSGRIDYDISKIDKRCLRIAFQVSEKLKFQSMAYDFIYNKKNKPVICEISYIYVEEVIKNAPGYWDRNLQWHSGHYWPQYFHLKDALKVPNLRQPDIVFEKEKFSFDYFYRKLFNANNVIL